VRFVGGNEAGGVSVEITRQLEQSPPQFRIRKQPSFHAKVC
jgi:hypothetical protein